MICFTDLVVVHCLRERERDIKRERQKCGARNTHTKRKGEQKRIKGNTVFMYRSLCNTK